MIREIVEDLISVDEKTWALYAYRKEPLRGKIAFDDYYTGYFLKAKEDGVYLAGICAGKSIEDLLKESSVKVEMIEMRQGQSVYNFAVYNEPDTIQIYKDNADESQMVVDALEDDRIQTDIKKMLIAHELFHALQCRYPDMFVNKPHIRLWKLFGFENMSRFVSLEEVAAMYFAKEYLHINAVPYLYDVIMCMSRAPKRAKEIYQNIMSLKEEING